MTPWQILSFIFLTALIIIWNDVYLLVTLRKHKLHETRDTVDFLLFMNQLEQYLAQSHCSSKYLLNSKDNFQPIPLLPVHIYCSSDYEVIITFPLHEPKWSMWLPWPAEYGRRGSLASLSPGLRRASVWSLCGMLALGTLPLANQDYDVKSQMKEN